MKKKGGYFLSAIYLLIIRQKEGADRIILSTPSLSLSVIAAFYPTADNMNCFILACISLVKVVLLDPKSAWFPI